MHVIADCVMWDNPTGEKWSLKVNVVDETISKDVLWLGLGLHVVFEWLLCKSSGEAK